MVENDNHKDFHDSGMKDSQLDNAIKESQSLRHSLETTEQTIGLAIEANERMNIQRSKLMSSENRIEEIISTVPLIGELYNKINVRRKRDRLILGGLIGFLMFFCVFYLFG